MSSTPQVSFQTVDLAHLDAQIQKVGRLKRWLMTAGNPESTLGYRTAVAIGFLCVGIGGFGVLGLFHSHSSLSLPPWLTTAIGTVGNTPHLWSLSVMALGGIIVGVGLIKFGRYKLGSTPTHKKINGKIQDFYPVIGIESSSDQTDIPHEIQHLMPKEANKYALVEARNGTNVLGYYIIIAHAHFKQGATQPGYHASHILSACDARVYVNFINNHFSSTLRDKTVRYESLRDKTVRYEFTVP